MTNNTIVVITGGTSCTNASFSLAGSLREKGNRILYFDLNNNPSYIEKQGFEVVSIKAPALRMGEGKTFIPFSFFRRLRLRISAYAQVQTFTNTFCDQWIQDNKPNLALLDANLPGFVVPFLKNKIPIINISSTLASLNPDGAPPVFSGLFPRSSEAPLSGMKIKLSWMKLFWKQKLRDTVERIVIRQVSKGHELPVSDQIKQQGGSIKRTEYGWRLVAPEIILAPKCIDFAGPESAGNKLYSGACVYEGRKQDPLIHEHTPNGKEIIYCSLGTCSAAYAHKANFYRCLMEALEKLSDYQLILQMDEPWPLEKRTPSNVKIFRSVPQLDILKRAKAFITHGGASSIKEGIYYGTPMIVFPGWHDQFGNAARVAYHGIGLRGSMRTITTPKMISMLSDVLSSDTILRSVREMQKEVLKNDEITACTEFVGKFFTNNRS